MKLLTKRPAGNNKQNGDTIVEVLIAIAIAAFAIGISYSTAQRSLQQAIAAREHNQALNILENQVADLNYRFQQDANFNDNFAAKNNFCLVDNAKPGDTNWSIQQNGSITDNSPPATPPYSSNCQTVNGGANYFANIATNGPPSKFNSTTYTLTVRWYRLGGGINKASLFYKLNNSQSATLGTATIVPNPPSCSGTFPWAIGEDDTASPKRLALKNQAGLQAMYATWPGAWSIDQNCTYTLSIDTHATTTGTSDPYQQMFVEVCSDITATSCSLSGNSASTLYQSGLTSDITSSSDGTFTGTFNLSSQPKYILFKHCSLLVGSPCSASLAVNEVEKYDVSIVGS